jgi:Mn-containing catalase
MYHHVKKLMYTVEIGEPDPKFGKMLLEQFGGANGELAAAMQYSIQGINCEDAARKDLLMDIGTEELSHLEVVGALIRMHLKPMKSSREAAEADPLVAIAGGGGVSLFDSMGNAWTANYLKITGDVAVRSGLKAGTAIPDDARDNPHARLHRGTRQYGQTAVCCRDHRTHASTRGSIL